MPKTIIIWDQCGLEAIGFYVLEGDLRRFNGVYVNETDSKQELQDELSEMLEGKIALKEFPIEARSNDTYVIVAGFVP